MQTIHSTLLFLLILAICRSQAAEPRDALILRVDRFEFLPGIEHPALPDASVYQDVAVQVHSVDGAYRAAPAGSDPRPLRSLQFPARFSPDGVQAVASGVITELQRRGLGAVWVVPDASQIDPATGRDLREGGGGPLRLFVWTGRIASITTRAEGPRFAGEEQRKDRKEHGRILRNSPLQWGDLVWTDHLEEYLYWLNEHPGRLVEATLSPGDKPGELMLEYSVLEQRPWQLALQISNTGTESTGNWRNRFTFQHTQLTGKDDTLTVDYIMARNFGTEATFASYERPLFGPDSPRLRLTGSLGDFTTGDLGFADLRYAGDNHRLGLEISFPYRLEDGWEASLQAGFTWNHYEVEGSFRGTSFTRASSDFLIPHLSARLARRSSDWSAAISLRAEHSLAGIADDDRTNGHPALGRSGSSDNWTLLRAQAHLDLWADSVFWKTRSALPAHQLSLLLRSQSVLGSERLIPQEQQVLGGAYSVRGYDESLVSADNAFLGGFEYSLHTSHLLPTGPPSRLLGRDFALRPTANRRRPDWDLILRGFVDFGYRWNNNRVGGGFENEDFSLVSAGAGAEFRVLENLSVRCDLGTVLKAVDSAQGRVADPGDTRVHIHATLLW